MKNLPIFTLLLLFFSCGSQMREEKSAQSREIIDLADIETKNQVRTRVLFDFGWTFFRGDIKDGEKWDLDDLSWRQIDLPHDWSIEDIPGTDSPLDSNATGGISTGYFVGGTAWYRKSFKVPVWLAGKRIHLEFEGVYMNAQVWLNGVLLGHHPYGYTSFGYDITDLLKIDQHNVLAVKVENEGKNSRWYSGSGLYRHVWLMVSEPVYINPRSLFISTPRIGDALAVCRVETDVFSKAEKNEKITLLTQIIDDKGRTIAQASANKLFESPGFFTFYQNLDIESPKLWSPESPDLYTCLSQIFDEKNQKIDQIKTPFGIRSIDFSVENGFLLNGKPVLLKGGCMHHDNGPLGAAAYDRAEERRVELMKANGFNSIRCAHNPPSPAFLDACDRLGIMVIDEAFDMWRYPKNPQDYHLYFDEWWEKDIKSMVLRDRNHPSVIMWSIGNEIPERGNAEGVKTSRMLVDTIKKMDNTRPVTAAVNGLGPDKDPYFATLDIAGYNYSFGGDHGIQSIFEKDHQRLPQRIMYCSESYPLEAFGSWMDVLDYPFVFGDYVWTGFDYLGEASIGWRGYLHENSFYPWNHAFCGDIDICGFKRPQSYYRDVLWKNGNQLSIFVKPPNPSFEPNPNRKDWSKWHWYDVVADWNWPNFEGQPFKVEVYCSYEQVELFLGDLSFGKKECSRDNKWIAEWDIPYRAGTLKAIAYENNNQIAQYELSTATEPQKISLSSDRSTIQATGQDLSYITVEIQDKNGIRHPKAEQLVNFEIKGPGSILTVASSNPMSTESFQKMHRKAYKGRCLVVIKSHRKEGIITLTAKSADLISAQLDIKVMNSFPLKK